MSDPENDPATSDMLLRLSLIEGFTVAHLRRFRGGPTFHPRLPEIPSPPGGPLSARVEAALFSAKAARGAEDVREACARSGIAIVSWLSDEYPSALREIPDAPLVLYRAGAPWRAGTGVAVVGSRAPTGPGRDFARLLAGDLAAAGCVVVSGMARGIDGAAHRGALEAGRGTVAVLGCGPDVAYPPEHAGLRDEIAGKGTLYSEYPPGAPPLPRRFPARNRIVSGLCRGVVVAEAPERSGALITARLALDQGREVMAVPGNPWFRHTAGSNRLLQEGAAPVCCAADVLDALGVPPPGGNGDLPGRILAVLSRERHVAQVAALLSLELRKVLPVLMEMELANLVVKRAGDYYKRKS
ncbi:MAG: protecting protein DprA [Deltaproteobacteria bacterium]|nr:protecting protein DprA [Deltaproteobacteria bacterium]